MSQHPGDRLIIELLQTGRPATSLEIKRIIDRIATAPFDRRDIPVPPKDRGIIYLGCQLGSRADSLIYHLTKRVVIDEQWVFGTTTDDYLRDLHAAVRHSSTHIGIYRSGGRIAVTLTPTIAVVPRSRLGARSLPSLLVVYSADRGIIMSGYQISSLEITRVPKDVLWLR